jgi:hypothetical protein
MSMIDEYGALLELYGQGITEELVKKKTRK